MNHTAIEWTTFSSNPIYAYDTLTNKRGWACVKVSPGCARCYAETLNKRFGTMRDYSISGTAAVEFRISEKELAQYKRLKPGEMCFVGDMTDIFQDGVTDDMLHKLFHAMENYSVGTFQILTKRPKRMASYLQWRWGEGRIPCQRIWVGCSVEDQKRADERIPHLLRCPAAVRFLSVEPLLGPVDLDRWFTFTLSIGGESERKPRPTRRRFGVLSGVDPIGVHWVIAGGESGPGARDCDVEWVRSVVRQCGDAEVPCFVKQLGKVPVARETVGVGLPLKLRDSKGGDMSEWPEDLRVRQMPAADGRGR